MSDYPRGYEPLPPHLDPRGRHRSSRQPRRRGHAAVYVGRVLAAGLSVALLLTFGTYWWKYHAFSAGLNRLNVISGTHSSHDIDGKAQNLLIVGNDDRQTATNAELAQLHTGRDGGSLNTDTMMIVHVPADGTKATLISLPRDSYVDIPGFGQAKLNSAYVDGYNNTAGSVNTKRAGGAKVLINTVQNLTGLTVDHFVQVDLLGFYRISNAIGGVDVNMCAAVTDAGSGVNLHKGVNIIKGTQALAFVRQRYNFPNGLGDLDRVERQRYFLTAAFRKLTSGGVLLNPIKLQNLLNAIRSSLYMDSTLDPLGLARQMQNLSANNIVGKTIPTDGFANNAAGSVVVVNPAQVRSFVNALIGNQDSKLAAAKTVAPSSFVIDVLNAGSGINGFAKQNADTLRGAGFQVSEVGDNPSPSPSTVIEYADGMQSQAKTLATFVPGASLQQVPSIAHVTLLLGNDALTVKVPHTSASSSSGSSATTSTTATSGTTGSSAAPKPIDSGCIY